MTTVAVRDGVIASDSQQTIGKVIADGHCKKVFRLVDGSVIGFAGQVAEWEYFLDQMNQAIQEAGRLVLPQIHGCKQTYALMTDGEYTYAWERGWERPHKDFFAIGNGMFFAIAAMKAGADAKQAVKIAIDMDIYSGGRIQSISVGRA